jgi:hypothetical protein
METARSTETSVNFCQTSRRHIPEENLLTFCHENLKPNHSTVYLHSYILIITFIIDEFKQRCETSSPGNKDGSLGYLTAMFQRQRLFNTKWCERILVFLDV